ncbi:MAG: hypothetical protein LBQ89_07180, partial [Treponema sp.]|nr:hypothetical protein [Treponema sp.]
LYTPETAGRIWPKDLRKRYDFALAVLRREPLPPARWGDEHYKMLVPNSPRHQMFMQFEKSGENK